MQKTFEASQLNVKNYFICNCYKMLFRGTLRSRSSKNLQNSLKNSKEVQHVRVHFIVKLVQSWITLWESFEISAACFLFFFKTATSGALELTILTGKNYFTQPSTRSLAAPDLFKMITQSIKFFVFHCHMKT